MAYLVQNNRRARTLTGLLASVLPPGVSLMQNNRRERTLSAYDRRARYLSRFLGDDSDGIMPVDVDPTLIDSGGYYGGSGTVVLPSGGSYSTPIAPSLPSGIITGESPTGIIQGTGLPTYLPPSIYTPNPGPIAAGSTVLPSGTVVGPAAGSAGSSSVAPSGQVKSATTSTTILPSGQIVQGAPITGGVSASQWLASSTMISGWSNQTVVVGVGLATLALSILMKKKKRR